MRCDSERSENDMTETLDPCADFTPIELRFLRGARELADRCDGDPQDSAFVLELSSTVVLRKIPGLKRDFWSILTDGPGR